MENSRNKKNMNNQNDLKYFQINHKNKIVELSFDMHIFEASSFLNTLTPIEENLGGEINSFFLSVLPENKEGDILKVLVAVANKTKIDKVILYKHLTDILNRPEDEKITLNMDLCEGLSTVLREIFKKIKKKTKIKNFDDIKKVTQNYMDNLRKEDILKKFKSNNSSKTLNSKNNNKDFINTKLNDDNVYEYKEIKLSKNIQLPLEMVVLLRKFSMTKIIRLTINNDYYSNNDDFSKSHEYNINNKKNELENIILILLNLEWLFPSLVDLELDFSNINIMESQINLYKYSLEEFSKLINKETKITAYQISNHNKRNNESLYKSIFPQFSFVDDNDLLSDKTSTSNTSSQHIYLKQNTDYGDVVFSDEKYNKEFKMFVKKYMNLMEIMIIYSYFVGKMESIINAKFIMPLNIGDETYGLLRNKKIFINDFHFLSFISKKNLISFTIEFNSLDGQTFEKVLNFLQQNQNLCKCNISFFPDEEFFKTELLFKLLQSCDDNFKLKKHKDKNNKLNFNPYIIFNIKEIEELDSYILRKLSEYFEKNIQYFFYLLTMKTNILELSLIFDIPTILVKNGYYNNVLMKFFLNLFILLDSSNNNLKNLTLIAENFIFDSRKYPILNDFCVKINLFTKKNHRMQSFTFHAKIYKMPSIYRFIPYNLTYLSIGSLDYETFGGLVDYLTSSDFGVRTKLRQLKISLNNSLIDINQKNLYDILIRLFVDYPKEIKEISLYTFLIISYEQLYNLLIKTNYNTIPNIFLQFSLKSIINDSKLKKKLESDVNNEIKNTNLIIDNFLELKTVKRNNEQTNKIINLMMNLERINKNILNYGLFCNIEKFLCPNERKKIIIQFR